MKKFLIIFLTSLFLVGCVFILLRAYLSLNASRPILRSSSMPTLESSVAPSAELPTPPFNPGEKFDFFYNIGPLRTGDAELTFVGQSNIDGKEAYLVKFESGVGTFYDLENIYAETETFYPIYVERNIKNFGLETSIKEKYDQKDYKIEIIKKGLFGENRQVIKKENHIQNALLLIYYCRKLSPAALKIGYEFNIVLPVDEFKITLTRIEKIKVPAGIFKAYVFESSPRRIKLWIATDQNHTPLKMENLTSFGPSSIILEGQ